MLKKSMFSPLITAIFLIVFSTGCANSVVPTETSILSTPVSTETPVNLPPTEIVHILTEIVSPISEPPTAGYFELTPEQRIEKSIALVEKASGFSGEVGIPIQAEDGKTYNFYWDPTAVDKDETPFVGAWRTEAQSNNLDKTGESLPPIVMPGYENPDGSLVVVDPFTGQETTYANPNIPALGGEISYRDLFNLSQDKIADAITAEALRAPEFASDADMINIVTKLREQAIYLPVLIYGEQTSVYAHGFETGGSYPHDLPEAQFTAIQDPTNNALVPIYSPETGDFMFFINISSGNPLSYKRVEYKPDGSVNADTVGNKVPDSFGINGQDRFGFIAQSIYPQVAHNLGGGSVFNENSPVVGDINVVEQILNASSEKEIFRILNQYRFLVAYPSVVYTPAR